MLSLFKMAIQWAKLQKNLTHGITALFSYFWMRYILDTSFRHEFWMYIHTLPIWLRGLVGFLISFSMWYHNPIKQKLDQKRMEKYEKDNCDSYGRGLGPFDNGTGPQSNQSSPGPGPSDH